MDIDESVKETLEDIRRKMRIILSGGAEISNIGKKTYLII